MNKDHPQKKKTNPNADNLHGLSPNQFRLPHNFAQYRNGGLPEARQALVLSHCISNIYPEHRVE